MLDLSTALATARLFVPGDVSDPAAAADLQRQVAAEWAELDEAARSWADLGAALPPTTGRVVGRLGWVKANLATIEPIAARVGEHVRRPSPGAGAVMSAQVGALFGLLSTKVLGQFILPLAGPGSGQLVIVGPNVLSLALEFPEQADDIRRSVLVHEIVHRLQFDGTSWLGTHLRGLLSEYVDEIDVDPDRLRRVSAQLPGAIRRAREAGSVEPLLDTILTSPQRDLMHRAQALMSLLEGHGNASMSLAAASVVADPDAVREALASRRGDLTTKVLTTVAGLDLKRRQYDDGEAFVRAVVDEVGIAGLNRAFDDRTLLPTLDEITDPAAWLARTA